MQRRRARARHCFAGRRATAHDDAPGMRLSVPRIADDGILEGRRRLQMPDDVFAATERSAQRALADGHFRRLSIMGMP